MRQSPCYFYIIEGVCQINAITSGIVAIERIVDTVTSRDTYFASQLYFSANMVALEAAGVEASSITTVTVSPPIGIPASCDSFIKPSRASGSTRWRRARNRYICASEKKPLRLISASRSPITVIDKGATSPLTI